MTGVWMSFLPKVEMNKNKNNRIVDIMGEVQIMVATSAFGDRAGESFS
ncbi:hypothetical protein [Desulfosporosinus fructosivorans]|nr:hypothetical protein [Desulfosporosinus fructosivorans]